jgi:hypothetical protein
VKDIKFFTIMTTGRTGSDYLAACLDNVPGVLVFSGKFDLFKFFKNVNEFKNKKKLINKFILKYKKLLGKNKLENIDLSINIHKFKKYFLKISNERINSKEFLLNLYISYNNILGRKTEKIKSLVHHSHSVQGTEHFLQHFKNAGLLITVRHPLENLKSGLIGWAKINTKYKSIQSFIFYLKKIRNSLNYALKIKNKKIFIKLEEANLIKTKKQICKFLEIKFNKNIFYSTIGGKFWVGDILSDKKNKNGEFNKDVLKKTRYNFFSKKEIMILNHFYRSYKKFYYFKKENFFSIIKIFIYSFLPFKYELLILKTRRKYLFTNLYHLIKRIIYLQLNLLIEKK